MSSTNGRSVFDVVTNGYHRSVISIGGSTIGVSIPVEIAEEHGVEKEDDVVITEVEDDGEDSELKLELHFG